MGGGVPSTRSSCFRSWSSARHRARSAVRSSTPSVGAHRPRLRAPPVGRSRVPGRRGTMMVLFMVLPLRGAAALDPRDADGGPHAHDDEPFAVRHPTARLPAWSHAPGAPEDDVARGGGHRPQSRCLGVEVRIERRPSISGRLPRAERGRHHEDRQECPRARRGDALDPWRLTAGPPRGL